MTRSWHQPCILLAAPWHQSRVWKEASQAHHWINLRIQIQIESLTSHRTNLFHPASSTFLVGGGVVDVFNTSNLVTSVVHTRRTKSFSCSHAWGYSPKTEIYQTKMGSPPEELKQVASKTCLDFSLQIHNDLNQTWVMKVWQVTWHFTSDTSHTEKVIPEEFPFVSKNHFHHKQFPWEFPGPWSSLI